ncbi:hypothetical protein D5S17_09315 [Pseudonocardiaceae bacterium YIM PH 21723]|nr:hypothetical protein D5S17_09315 [Pseudonocardiaceae bacterium YIM PH 21723]
MTEVTDIDTRIARGCTWLDTIRPGWRNRDWTGFDIANVQGCVLGIVFTDDAEESDCYSGFDYVLNELLPAAGFDEEDRSMSWSAQHGFDTHFGGTGDGVTHAVLQAAWCRELGIENEYEVAA